jgi:hypothetical protein
VRPSVLLRSLTAVSLLALVTGLSSGAMAAPPQLPAPDPCSRPSAGTVPAACVAASGGATAGGTDTAVATGGAFVDGLVSDSPLTGDKLTFPPGDMTAPQVVRHEADNSEVFGYDFTPDGSVLYAVDNATSSLIIVDQTTGVEHTVGAMVNAGDTWTDLFIDPSTGAAYATSGNLTGYTLYSVNLTTGSTIPIVSAPTTQLPLDFAINCAGQIYAETAVDNMLNTVNPTTGALTPVGPLGWDINYAQGMDFDNATGILHAWIFTFVHGSAYTRVNLATGAATIFSGVTPAGEFEGAIRTECPPPTVSVTSGPDGKTGDLRPTFGFASVGAATTQCSIDRGTAAFVPCPGRSYRPPANLVPGSWTFRVQGTRGPLIGQTSRAFTVVDCKTLTKHLARAKRKVASAKRQLEAARRTDSVVKIRKARAKLSRARKSRRKARVAYYAEPVCR